MSAEDLELLVTLDDPGEDDLKEDTFNHFQAANTVAQRPVSRSHQGGDKTSKQKSLSTMTPPSVLSLKFVEELRGFTPLGVACL